MQQQQQIALLLEKMTELADKVSMLPPIPTPASPNINIGNGAINGGGGTVSVPGLRLGESEDRAAKRRKLYEEFAATATTQAATSDSCSWTPLARN